MIGRGLKQIVGPGIGDSKQETQKKDPESKVLGRLCHVIYGRAIPLKYIEKVASDSE